MTRILLALSFIALAACSSSGGGSPTASAEKPSTAMPAGTTHAASSKPGSHDDWCEEHGVPESKCTQCNPKLIPAFKANKDWCEEHALPESQCTKCDPSLKITRPPKEG